MDRTRAVIVLGLICIVLGAVLIVGAHDLAMNKVYSDGGSWAGFPNPEKEAAYRLIGIAVLGFGLLLESFAIYRWAFVSERPRNPRLPSV